MRYWIITDKTVDYNTERKVLSVRENRTKYIIIIGFLYSLLIILGFTYFVMGSSMQINYSGFESGEQGWIDGGTDSLRSSIRSNVSDNGVSGGSWSWDLQDNTITSYIEQAFNFTGYDLINISWFAYYTSIEGSEGLELRCDGTTLWRYQANTLGTEDRWLGIENGQDIAIYPQNCIFDSSVTIRFEAEFSGDDDDVFLDGINLSGVIFGVVDNINPNVTALLPLSGNIYNTSDVIEISANATDDVNVSHVSANIILPNGTVEQMNLVNANGSKYNSSFVIPNIAGRYSIRIIANDTSNNLNDSETTYFDVDGNFSFVNGEGFGYLSGLLENVYFYNGSLQLESEGQGNFTSQVFDAGENVSWKNVSWDWSSCSSSFSLILNPIYAESAFGVDITSAVNISDASATWERVEIQSWNDSLALGEINSVTGFCEIDFIDAGAEIGFQVSRNNGSTWDSEVCVQSVSEFNTYSCDLKTNSGVDTIDEINNLRMRCTFPTAAQNDFYSTDWVFVEVNYSVSSPELNFSVMSCDDSVCSGEIWIDINDSSPENLSLIDNHYFQYKVEFSSIGESPKLYNVSISYETISEVDNVNPNINFVLPTEVNGSILNRNYILVNVSASDNIALQNITIYLYNSTTFINSTIALSSPNFVNFSNLKDGVYYFNASAYDSSGNANWTETRTITLDTAAPSISIANPAGANYTNATILVNITSNGLNVWFFNGTENESYNGAIYRTFNQGNNQLIAYANDSAGNFNFTSVSFFVDSIKPTIDNLIETPSDPAAYVGGAKYEFNATINDSNLQTVLIEFNGVNYSASNISNVYNFSISNLAAGEYNYYWSANDSLGNGNVTEIQSYTINKSSQTAVLNFNESSPIVYGTFVNATCNGELFRDEINVTSEKGFGVLLGAGGYDYSCKLYENQNYSYDDDNSTFIVNQALGNVSLLLNNSASDISFVYGDFVNASARSMTGAINLTRDGADVNNENSLFVLLGAGYYNYTAHADATQNYSAVSLTRFVNVTGVPDTISPAVSIVYPLNQSYNFVVRELNYTVSDANLQSCWYSTNNGITNVSISCGVNISIDSREGNNAWKVYANDASGNQNYSGVVFFVNTLQLTCEAGGPYQQGALVLVQGILRNESGVLEGESVNVSVLKNGAVNYSQIIATASDGGYEAQIFNLIVGSYLLTANVSVNGINQSCIDSLSLGGNAKFVLDKIATVYNASISEIVYNISLKLTNNGLANALNVNVSDDDGGLVLFGDVNVSSSFEASYLLNFARGNTTSYYFSDFARAFGIDEFSGNGTGANSSTLNLTIPSASIGKQIVITKNVIFLSEENLNVSYNISSTLFNSGDEELSDVIYIDTDISGVAILLNLSKGNSREFSNVIIIDKAASNTVHQFALGSAIVSAETFYSNRPSINIPGYGGPADAVVYAPASVNVNEIFNSIIEVSNVNEDIGQDFIVSYWITNEGETVNYSSGQRTIYVPAQGATSLSVDLIAPSIAGDYRLRALVVWIAGTATSFDSFEVIDAIVVEEPADEREDGDGGSVVEKEDKVEKIIERETIIERRACEEPYIESGGGCCLDENENSICDESEIEEPEELEEIQPRGITGFFIKQDEDGIKITLLGQLIIFLIIFTIVYLIIRMFPLIFKKKRKVNGESLKAVRGIKVFTTSGMEIGKVKEIIIGESRVDSLKIKLNRKYKRKGIYLSYRHVENVRDVVIVDERILEEI